MAAPRPEQLLVGVDVVARARRIRLGRPQTLGEPDEHDPDGGTGETEVLVQVDPARESQLRQAGRDRSHDLDTLVVEVEHRDDENAEGDGDEGTGDQWQVPPEPEHEEQRQDPHEERRPVRPAEGGDQSPELLEEVAGGAVDAEQLGQLAHDDGQREADDEALEDRFGDEPREEAQPQQAGDERDHSGDDGQRRGEGDVVAAAGVGDRRDGRRRESGGRGHRTDDEVPRGPEHRVEHEGRRRRIQADDRGRARDGGVCERLRHEDRPDGRPRHEVVAQPRRLVPAQTRGKDAHGHLSHSDRASSCCRNARLTSPGPGDAPEIGDGESSGWFDESRGAGDTLPTSRNDGSLMDSLGQEPQ